MLNFKEEQKIGLEYKIMSIEKLEQIEYLKE